MFPCFPNHGRMLLVITHVGHAMYLLFRWKASCKGQCYNKSSNVLEREKSCVKNLFIITFSCLWSLSKTRWSFQMLVIFTIISVSLCCTESFHHCLHMQKIGNVSTSTSVSNAMVMTPCLSPGSQLKVILASCCGTNMIAIRLEEVPIMITESNNWDWTTPRPEFYITFAKLSASL